MFDKLIPWKKRHGNSNLSIGQDRVPGLSQFRQEFDSLWDRFWDDCRGLADPHDGMWSRGVRLEEAEKEFVLHAELPGFDTNDFDIKVNGNMLTLRAEHKDEGQGKNGGHYRSYGSFFESFTLPEGVVTDKIDARYRSGVLEVHVPKSKDYKSTRIPVTAA